MSQVRLAHALGRGIHPQLTQGAGEAIKKGRGKPSWPGRDGRNLHASAWSPPALLECGMSARTVRMSQVRTGHATVGGMHTEFTQGVGEAMNMVRGSHLGRVGTSEICMPVPGLRPHYSNVV